MRWLIRLVTSPGTVLDPFARSSTTLLATRDEGMSSIGIEQHEPWARLSEPYAVGLFGAAPRRPQCAGRLVAGGRPSTVPISNWS
ncbi:DNA methyltransferase [Streptomyces sp. NBC_00838]|uniref:DNA methyltransferase n=1 Tax=Streptomyces sp. NBC_00838 TaxID=2903680 RepID=UPI003865478F